MTTTTYENSVRIGSTTYRLAAAADPELSIDLAGTDTSGALVAEGTLRLPADAGARIGKLLAQVLEALGKLSGAPPTGARDRPANANLPWTPDVDEELRTDWLAAEPATPTADLIRTIAKRLERSPTSIRSRLAKVGCDPDVPGRALSDEGARVFRIQARDQGLPRELGQGPGQGRDQGRIRATPDSGKEGVE